MGSFCHNRGKTEVALIAGSEVRSIQLKHLFKPRVNRSSLANLPLPHWGCFTFLRKLRA